MDQTISSPSSRHIERSLLIVEREDPLKALRFISDALMCVGVFLRLESGLDKTAKAEAGAGLILDLLAYALLDVQDALNEKYSQFEKGEGSAQ